MKLISTFLVILFAYGTLSKKLQIYKVDVDVDPKYLKIWNQLRNDGGTNVVDVDLEVLESVENVDFRITLFKNCSDHFESYFRSGVISGCHENDINDKVLMFIFKELAKYGNVTKACPLKKGQYTLRGFKIDEKELPGELPNGEYRADFQASMKINDHDFPVYTDRYYFTNS